MDNVLAKKLKREQLYDKVFVGTTRLFATLVLLILGGILVSLIYGAWPSIQKFGFDFLTSSNWDVVAGEYGALAPIYGTILTSIIALGIATPVSFGIAIFLTELCPKFLKKPLGICIELLAGIPSIIYGMWGLFVFAPIFADHVQPALAKTIGQIPVLDKLFSGVPMGIGILAAGLILAIMIIPFIASVMRDVFEVTPPMLKESAYGLGATRWEVIRSVVLPYTKSGVVGGIILGLGRALGETMAVTFIIGNTFNLSLDLFGSGVSITSALANEFAEAIDPMHVSSLLFLGLILFIITFIVLCISKLMLMRMTKNEGR
ncbi:phosphate ABC transporter permease [Moraxella ovis]|uniref:Phosphate transport system permease protein n=1 Tax=Moraxella ovis TaxID=29433 RepID=A0A160GE77_9GAMM|nr:phosphate ABC transporter permease subunit PstC [Moraxella ovis]ANB91198.1 phosphate ABC transporter permease [Moraxella ovis]SPX84939.1 Phosphate transport system permease protein pstC [Moraxella ovis]STY86734.1 Phosphate transport system permease protein pstC [Moraxella ovis]STZ05362.1 Phosphate transport system permease protein pstC [Moraxella ovis]